MSGTPLVDPRASRTVVRVGAASFGEGFAIVAGPCAIESKAQLLTAARAAAAAGAAMLRAGAFKPRTSPYAFQGLGTEALPLLNLAAAESGLPVVSEVLGEADIPAVSAHAQMLQVGSRNMQNFPLLSALGRQGLPILLKRGHMATISETLHAAEYIAKEGNTDIVLCERGIRAFDPSLRFTLDLAGALVLRERTHLPVIVDPSHATGAARLVPALALAAQAAGLDGVMVEIHPTPGEALSDGPQSLDLATFARLMEDLGATRPAPVPAPSPTPT